MENNECLIVFQYSNKEEDDGNYIYTFEYWGSPTSSNLPGFRRNYPNYLILLTKDYK